MSRRSKLFAVGGVSVVIAGFAVGRALLPGAPDHVPIAATVPAPRSPPPSEPSPTPAAKATTETQPTRVPPPTSPPATPRLDCSGSDCARIGACVDVAGRCEATRSEHCSRSAACAQDGKCSLVAGRCVVFEDADCARATVCTRDGRCRVRDGECASICSPNPCVNGRCRDVGGQPACECPSEYVGVRCAETCEAKACGVTSERACTLLQERMADDEGIPVGDMTCKLAREDSEVGVFRVRHAHELSDHEAHYLALAVRDRWWVLALLWDVPEELGVSRTLEVSFAREDVIAGAMPEIVTKMRRAEQNTDISGGEEKVELEELLFCGWIEGRPGCFARIPLTFSSVHPSPDPMATDMVRKTWSLRVAHPASDRLEIALGAGDPPASIRKTIGTHPLSTFGPGYRSIIEDLWHP